MESNFFGILPAIVRHAKGLSASAKVLYAEITALATSGGYCFASNAYLAEIADVAPQVVSGWIADLRRAGFVRVELNKRTNERKIYPLAMQVNESDSAKVLSKSLKAVKENLNTSSGKDEEVLRKSLKAVKEKININKEEEINKIKNKEGAFAASGEKQTRAPKKNAVPEKTGELDASPQTTPTPQPPAPVELFAPNEATSPKREKKAPAKRQTTTFAESPFAVSAERPESQILAELVEYFKTAHGGKFTKANFAHYRLVMELHCDKAKGVVRYANWFSAMAAWMASDLASGRLVYAPSDTNPQPTAKNAATGEIPLTARVNDLWKNVEYQNPF